MGLNHETTPLSMRERLTLTEAQQRAALARCGCGDREAMGGYSELILLSTCNRIELYAEMPEARRDDLVDLLGEITAVPPDLFREGLYQYIGRQAVAHLFRVAAGLDSMILGEPQILGQVAEAYTRALRVGSTGLILSRLFQCAIHAGKRAHHETSISSNPASVSSVAVHLIASIVSPLSDASVLVVGAGEMAELAVEALRKRGVSRITVVNRSVSRARELADRWGAEARAFEDLGVELAKADVVISSTGAPHTIFQEQIVREGMVGRPDRPLIMMDIAVPRDVDPAVRLLDHVHLYDIDELQHHFSQSLEERQAEVPRVQAILDEELGGFWDWHRQLEIRPVIKAMHQRAEAIRCRELDVTLRRLPNLDREAGEQIEALTRALVKKLLHDPTMCLKEQSLNGQAAHYALYARELFGLDMKEPPARDSG
jgi:glutamyl-tRNA reductase